MKILLVGEYSGFHNSLKKGLLTLGHQVVIVGNGDSFKKFPVDIALEAKWFKKKWFLKKIKNVIYSFTSFDLADVELYYRYKKIAYLFKDYDVIQLVNSIPFLAHPKTEKKIFVDLLKRNPKCHVFLHGGGTEVPWVNFMLNQKEGFSSLTPYLKDNKLKSIYKSSLKYTLPEYKRYFSFLLDKLSYIIPSDIDYQIAYKWEEKACPMISAPIDYSVLEYKKIEVSDKIIIFCGINSKNKHSKGISFFLEALDLIKKKYANKVQIQITRNLPYKEYIKVYDESHILLDQCLSYDQGYNAREAMAKGKVVFSGANADFKSYYDLSEKEMPLIEAKPDVAYLVSKLSFLIENPEVLSDISIKARAFIEKHHNHNAIAKKYLNTWASFK